MHATAFHLSKMEAFQHQHIWIKVPWSLHLLDFCIFSCCNCVFQKAQRKMPMPFTFLAWYLGCIEYSQLTIALLCPFRSCLVPWDWFPLMLNIYSPHWSQKKLQVHLTSQDMARSRVLGQLGKKEQNSCTFAPPSAQMFSGLPALQKAGKVLDIYLEKAHITCTISLC